MSNPMVEETGLKGFISKFKTKKDDDVIDVGNSGTIASYLIGMSNAVNTCSEACGCCWDKPIPETYDGREEYIRKRSAIGHTSVIEHSNYVMLLVVAKDYSEDLMKFLGYANYLHKIVKFSNDGDIFVLLGGSYRAYSDLYKEADDLNNIVLKAVTGNLYMYADACMFDDICSKNLLDKTMFSNIIPDENCLLSDESKVYDSDLFKVVEMTDIAKLLRNINRVNPEFGSMITTYDLLPFATITVLFKNMSRTATHQLVRHRNGITQESQRYVDYSNGSFSSPALFKPDKYDSEHKYPINFAASGRMHLTLQEIGDAIVGIYNQLRNPALAGADNTLLKEDARAFLPGNVQCRKIYMTFTFKSLLKFLYLREDKAAQAEIRLYATSLGDWFRSNTIFNTKEICDSYTLPKLCVEDNIVIDEVVETKEEQVNVTEDDYIRAMNLGDESTSDTTE